MSGMLKYPPRAAESGPKPRFRDMIKKDRSSIRRWIAFVDDRLNRPLAWLLVRILEPTRVMPHHVTLASAALGLGAAVLLGWGRRPEQIAGAVLAQVSSVIDGADGMLARVRNQVTEFGGYLDVFCDRVVDFAILFGLGIGLYLRTGSVLLGGGAIMAAGLHVLHTNLYYIAKFYRPFPTFGNCGEARAILYWGLLVMAVLDRMDIAAILLFAEGVIGVIFWIFAFFGLGREGTEAPRIPPECEKKILN
jgi:phosphatidylglycerophosphate synthase